jgi:hypothetical protein
MNDNAELPIARDNLEPSFDINRDDLRAGLSWDDYDYDPSLDHDPFAPSSPEIDSTPVWDDYAPDELEPLPDFPARGQDGLQGSVSPEPEDARWSWRDARLIGVERSEDDASARYEIGAIDLYINPDSGDLGGSYLPIAAFSDEAPADAFYHDLQRQIHEQGLTPWQVIDFAESMALAMNPEPETWRGAQPAEYAAYDYLSDLESGVTDEPPLESIDPLIQTAIELGGVVVEQEVEPIPRVDEAAFEALNAIGVQAENFDPLANPPPFHDPATGVSYWIGVFQPDRDDRENCVTSILSLGRNLETGAMEAQLAPCAPGDWDKAYASAEHLIQVAQKGGIEQVFDAAEGMALATNQREQWDTERGLPLETDATRDLADFTRDAWEAEL